METFTITVEPLGREIECREDQTILDACLRNGVWLPHSCTHGTCATCKCDIVDGDVDHGDASSFALMDFERDEGKLLTCCAKPRSDVVIEADLDVDEDIEVHPVQDYTGTVVALDTAPASETRASNGEPERYVTPAPSSSASIAPPARLANYVVAHSEYSGPLSRRMALLGLVATDPAEAAVIDQSDQAAPVAGAADAP